MEINPHTAGSERAAGKPWAVTAKFDVKAGCETEWLQLVQEVTNAMRHEKTFISTSMCVHPSEAGKFLLFEVWEDRDEFFTVQVKRAYRRTLMERLPALLLSPVIFEEWHEIRANYAIQVRR